MNIDRPLAIGMIVAAIVAGMLTISVGQAQEAEPVPTITATPVTSPVTVNVNNLPAPDPAWYPPGQAYNPMNGQMPATSCTNEQYVNSEAKGRAQLFC